MICIYFYFIFRAEITWSEAKNYDLNFSEGQYDKAHVLFLQAAKADPNSWVRHFERQKPPQFLVFKGIYYSIS